MPGPSDCGQPNAVGSVNLAAVNLSSTPDKEVLDKDNINEKSAREQSQPVFLEQKKVFTTCPLVALLLFHYANYRCHPYLFIL